MTPKTYPTLREVDPTDPIDIVSAIAELPSTRGYSHTSAWLTLSQIKATCGMCVQENTDAKQRFKEAKQ
jgi:hypothetical protein